MTRSAAAGWAGVESVAATASEAPRGMYRRPSGPA